MRKINLIIIHCDASDNPKHDNAETIDRWHKERGWSEIGYNYFIRSNGTIEIGRSIEKIPAHAKGYNSNSIGICLHGLDKFTVDQFQSAAKLVKNLLEIHDLEKKDVIPHNMVNKHKTCPNFDISKILDYLQ